LRGAPAAPPANAPSGRQLSSASDTGMSSSASRATWTSAPAVPAASNARVSARENEEVERLRVALETAQRELADLRKSVRDEEVPVQVQVRDSESQFIDCWKGSSSLISG
jgi:hypothetical protein